MTYRLCVAFVLLLPAAALAQATTGPFGGLFGRTPHRTGLDVKVFEIRGSSGLEWNDFLSTRDDEPDPPFAGAVGIASAGMHFDRRSDRLDLRAGSTLEYRNSFAAVSTRGTTFDGGFVLNGRPTTRVSTELSANYRHSPFYNFFPRFSWLNEGVAVSGLPYDVSAISSHMGQARIGASYQYSKSSSLSGSAMRGETRFPTSPFNNVTFSDYEGSWNRRLNRDFSLRLGYGYRESDYHADALGDLIEEQINIGVDFNRALTVSPRTTIAFTTHTSMQRRTGGERRFRVNGEFLLTRRFQRTWRLQLDAQRSTEIIPGFVEPLLADSLSVAVSGQFSKRIEFLTALRGSHGRFGYEGESGPFTIAGSVTQLNMAVTRHFGIYSQYGLYYHDTAKHLFAPTTLGEMSRQTVSVGITTWIPVYTRERIPIDSR